MVCANWDVFHTMSQSTESEGQTKSQTEQKNSIIQWFGVIVLIYLLIVAVGVIGAGFKSATGEQAEELFAFATIPLWGSSSVRLLPR